MDSANNLSGICSQGTCISILETSGVTCAEPSECASTSCYAGVCQSSTVCVHFPASCALGCSLPNTCLVLLATFSDYYGKKQAQGGSCRGSSECLSGIYDGGFCTLKTPDATCTSSPLCASNNCVVLMYKCYANDR